MRQLLATLRHRPAPFIGTFIALAAAAMIVTWAFSLGVAGGTSKVPAQRLAATAAVVIGRPEVTVTSGHGQTATSQSLPLTSYRRIPAALAGRLGATPGVKAAVAGELIPVSLELPDGRILAGSSAQPITGEGWQSALLTPFILEAGHAPAGKNQLVIGQCLARRTGLSVGSQVHLVGQDLPAFTVAGVAAALEHDAASSSTVLFSHAEAARLFGHSGQADLIGIVAEPGTSAARLAARVRAAVAGDHLSVLIGSNRGKADGTPGRLASAEIRTRVRRMAAAVVAIALPVTFAGALVLIDATAAHGAVVDGHQRLAASDVVTSPSPGLVPSIVTAIRAQPGVTGAVGLAPTTVFLSYTGVNTAPGEAVTSGPLTSLVHLGVTSGSLSGFGTGDIALSNLVAGKGAMNVRIGQAVTVHLADGTPYRAIVTAIYSRGLGFATALIPLGAAGGGHLGARTLGDVLVGSAPGTAPRTLSSEIGSLAALYPGLRVASRRVVNAQSTRLTSQTSFVNNLLLALIGLLAGVALINTLVVATLQGRDELALLRRVGATVHQLLAKAAWQTSFVILIGVIFGAGAASTAVIGVSRALTGSWVPHFTWEPLATILGLVLSLTTLAVVVPTLRMVRGRGEP